MFDSDIDTTTDTDDDLSAAERDAVHNPDRYEGEETMTEMPDLDDALARLDN